MKKHGIGYHWDTVAKKKKKQDPLHAIIDATEYNSITD
jgi:hypothetical protein